MRATVDDNRSTIRVTARPADGSFRDPSSRVFIDGADVWRGLTAEGLADFQALAASQFFTAALDRGDIIATEVGSDPSAIAGNWAGVLRHGRVDVLSYPYEWSFEMLRDAARLQLELTREALSESLITKDASAYNVQFVGAKPVFIDVGSFERVRPGEPWTGYRQFCELFLNPLYLQALTDVPFQPLLRGRVEGITPGVAAAIMGSRGRLRTGVFTNVRLHARAERKYANADREGDVRAELRRVGFGPGLIDAQLRNLQKAVERLTWKEQDSTWSDYSDRGHYTDVDLAAKSSFVADAVAKARSAPIVLDLGANDGRFSRIAVDSGARYAVAVDSDHLVVDRLYRQLREQGERRILPLVLDVADPSPAIGWRGRERLSFAARMRPDLVLCLAVVHHLALTANVPLDEIVSFLADFGAPVVVEFPHRTDPMATRLLARKRSGLFDSYDIVQWERSLEQRFTVSERLTLSGGTRTLYRAEPR